MQEVFNNLTNRPEFNKTEDIFDQEKFALLSHKLIERLGYGEQLGELDDIDSDLDENNEEEIDQQEEGQGSDNEENDNAEESEADDTDTQQGTSSDADIEDSQSDEAIEGEDQSENQIIQNIQGSQNKEIHYQVYDATAIKKLMLINLRI